MKIDPTVFDAKFPHRCRLERCQSRCCRGGVWADLAERDVILRNAELFVPDDGLVYLQSPRKNPAGCTTPGDGVRSLIAPQQETRVRDLFLTRSRFRRKGSPE